MQRLIQAIALAQDLEGARVLRAAALGDFRLHCVKEITGRQLNNEECDDRDEEEQRDHRYEPPHDKSKHRGFYILLTSLLGCLGRCLGGYLSGCLNIVPRRGERQTPSRRGIPAGWRCARDGACVTL